MPIGLTRCAIVSRLAVAFMAIATLSVPPAHAQECLSANRTGTDDGFYYEIWKDNPGTVNFCLLNGGRYTAQWSGVNNWVGGKGWHVGARRVVSYSGTFSSPGVYLSLYGWTTDPVIEYYIVDDWGTERPPGGERGAKGFMGTVFSDGDTYDIYRTRKVDAPSIRKNGDTFYQYWSVRQHRRSTGTITTGNHFDAWAALGMNLGAFDYQMMAIEGDRSGTSDVTVSEGGDSSASP
ncbi:glycoside hydrolase family 11 protein [Mycolicibacterium sp. Dal123E01]|uniref:glycoside hydrolase family 11 protein n=1 Tax=Mycolicibacterium sp. Dal123E01 TaxID=3457578 RepID=UPI00403E5672